MESLILDLALSAERLSALYRGHANRIQALSRDGRQVSIPAHHFRSFVTHDGLYGTFSLQFSNTGKLLSLQRLP